MYQKGEMEQGIPWRQAQQIYSAMGSAIAKGKGLLPDEVYHALTGVQDMIDEGMKTAARNEGLEGQFLAFRDEYKKFAEDFLHSDASLKPLLDAAPDEHEAVLKAMLADPEKRIRITRALARWEQKTGRDLGLSDLNDLSAKWRDPTELNRRIQEAARLEQQIAGRGPREGYKKFSASEAAATRKQVGKAAGKIGMYGAGGAAAAYVARELYKALAPSPAKIQP
jgi:hypothetical protein